jgi:glycosyltransferase involved in cell wall biosynthesis
MRIVVVIPARNEELLIGRCLESVVAAAAFAGVEPQITVVADACTDATAEVARQFAGVQVLEVDGANVGLARGVGVAGALERAGAAASTIWIANTDADSVVPLTWIADQVDLEARGTDLVIGTVRPDFDDLTAEQVAGWLDGHTPGSPNGHVHGANLGIRGSIYEAAGGFAPLAEHEDVDLVARCAPLTSAVVATDTSEVLTSGRQFGRTDGGYARYLRTELLLAAE